MEFSRSQLKLLSILCALFAVGAIGLQLILHPVSMEYLEVLLGGISVVALGWFAFDYYRYRRYKDLTLEYAGANFVFFVLCRPLIPFALMTWSIYAMRNGIYGGFDTPIYVLALLLAGDAAEFLRLKQNGFEREPRET